VAQFHGRWPYLRVLGVEQPVAALASLIHLASALLTLHRLLSPLPSHTSSLLVAWSAHLVGVCVASLASLALHTLASPATEACHRASLLLPGITSLGLLGARANGGTTRLLLLVLLLCFCLATPLLALHLGEELTQVRVVVTSSEVFLWTIWLGYHRHQGSHIRSALAGVLLHLASSLLLLPNFPPLLWLVDGGALALLAAAPAPLLWRALATRDLG